MDIERRQYPRIPTDESIQIIDIDGSALPAVALDISLLGMQLLCDSLTARRITRSLDAEDNIQVRFPVTTIDGEGSVGAWCRVVYLRQFPEDECRLGLRYQSFVGASYNWLESFVDQRVSYPDERLLNGVR